MRPCGGLGAVVDADQPGSHPQPAQAQTTTAPRWELSNDNFTAVRFSNMREAVSPITVPETTSTAPQPKPVRVVLERTASRDDATWGAINAWHQMARSGNMSVARLNSTLTYYDGTGKATVKLSLDAAWVAEYRFEQRDGRVVEIVTLSAKNMQRVAP